MGGEGSMQAMQNILKNNKMLLRKKNYFRSEKSFLNRKNEFHKASQGIVDIHHATKEDLIKIRKKIIKQRRLTYWRTVIVFLIVAPIFIYATISFFPAEKIDSSNTAKRVAQQKLEKFEYYLNDGDHYLEKGEWHNTIFQYNKAIELFPSNFSAHYRLAYAYTYQCRNTETNCIIAQEKVKQLIAKFPENERLLELEVVLTFAKK